jgi:hypothetical protein
MYVDNGGAREKEYVRESVCWYVLFFAHFAHQSTHIAMIAVHAVVIVLHHVGTYTQNGRRIVQSSSTVIRCSIRRSMN